MSKTRYYLNCPADEEYMCAYLGAEWDPQCHHWFVPEQVDAERLKRWWPSETQFDELDIYMIGQEDVFQAE
jgi:hypothetical protein|tara:strand:+ start:4511 stop:4723 length:213 start_codon:yes stop_codon:yes gene_type:complete